MRGHQTADKQFANTCIVIFLLFAALLGPCWCDRSECVVIADELVNFMSFFASDLYQMLAAATAIDPPCVIELSEQIRTQTPATYTSIGWIAGKWKYPSAYDVCSVLRRQSEIRSGDRVRVTPSYRIKTNIYQLINAFKLIEWLCGWQQHTVGLRAALVNRRKRRYAILDSTFNARAIAIAWPGRQPMDDD